ncbi:MAG: ribonuclease J [Acidobacteriota bacterium]|jgi:ribonuclease J
MQLLPLGGLGEFGANSMLVTSAGGDGVLLDAGAAFSDLEPFGVAYEYPDYSALEAPPLGLVLTHGHDDHLKGASHLALAFPEVVAFGSLATVARLRLNSDGDDLPAPKTQALSTDTVLTVGSWRVEALAVSHSIPGTLMLRLESDGATLVAASDFRLTPSALGETTSLAALAAWGRRGVDVALVDSTNVLVSTPPPPESEVAATLAELVAQARGAVVGVTFASHAGRFLQFAQAAVAAGRVVVPLGRGLDEMLAVQEVAGGLSLPPGTVRPPRELARLPRERLVIVATGSQGETGAAFTRLAVDGIAGFRLQREDVLIHAARIIPGNERRLATLFDHCVRRGATVVTAEQAPVHASGHPHRQELDEVLEALRPHWVIPVHGRRRHLEELAELARRHGCRTLVVENGQGVEWSDAELRPQGPPCGVGRVLVGEDGCAAVDPGHLRQRREVARSGLVIVTIPRASSGAGPWGEPEVSALGLAMAESERRYLSGGLKEELRRARREGHRDEDELRSTMTRWLRNELRRRQGCRPAVQVAIVGI